MSADAAIALMVGLIRTAAFLAGPVLLVSLAAGLLVGLIQAATQINEPSVSFIMKIGAVITVILVIGPMMAGYAVSYTRTSIAAIETVVH